MAEEEGLFQLTNYRDHPSNNLYKVFFFKEKQRADFFENMLNERSIGFESDIDEHKGDPLYLYAIHKTDYKEALNCNFLTMAEFRQPMLGEKKWPRYMLIVFFFLFLAVALIGFFLS